MANHGKKYRAAAEKVDPLKQYAPEEGVKLVKETAFAKFDESVATPDMMGMVGRLGKVLGPRGLMPNPRSGTVTPDIGRAIREIKGGRVEFRVDRTGVIHAPIGKVSFSEDKIMQNLGALV